jgi:xylulokinase
MILLGIDLGTSACKAALYAADGTMLAAGSAPLEVARPQPGWAEQEPEAMWHAACGAIRTALRTAGVQPGEVRAVCACGHSPTLILLDEAGRPVRPAIIWQDTRAAAAAQELAEAAGPRWSELLGTHFPVSPTFAPARLLWLQRHEPAVLQRARTALEPKDYLHYRLTGVRVSDRWSAKGLVHMATGRPIRFWQERFGLPDTLAPPIAEPHERIGAVTAEAAAQTGLLAGTPVACGWTDGLAAMLGSGAFLGDGGGYLVSGTSEVIGAVLRGAPSGDARLLEVPAPHGRLAIFGPTQCSGAALTWFVEHFLGGDTARALELAAGSPPGARGLIFLPYLEGERAPLWDATARGLFFGIALIHGPGDFVRAILEGVAASIRHVLDAIEEAAGTQVTHLRLAGGGARSGLWNQIKADILSRPVVLTSAEPGTLGAALLAGVAAGVWPDLLAASMIVRITGRWEPRPDYRARYNQLYELYRALYPRLRELYHALPALAADTSVHLL